MSDDDNNNQNELFDASEIPQAPRIVIPPDEDEPLYGLSDKHIEEIIDLLHTGYTEQLVEEITDLGPADAAELLAKISDDDRKLLLTEHGAAFDPYTFADLPEGLQGKVLNDMTAAQVAAILSEMDSDDALDMIVDLDPDYQQEIIRKLSAKMRVTLEEGLSFPEESAGRLMQREFVAIPQFWTVGKTIDYLRAAARELPDEFFDIFVITPMYRVVGVVPLNRILRSSRTVKLDDLKLEDIHPLPADMDQEEVARIFRREDMASAPVVDAQGRLIGVITFDDVADVITEEAEEDILKMSGVSGESDIHQSAMATSVSRFGWLFINLGTAFLDTAVISLFDETIKQIVVLAALMPVIASMGGNAGTQTLGVVIRALALNQLSSANLGRFIIKEVLVGTINGLWFAVILGLFCSWWYQNPLLGVAFAGASIIEHIIAGLSGVIIPVALKKFGSDPAVSSVVLLTTITDVMAFFSFLGLATLLLMH